MSEPILTKTTAAATYGGGLAAFIGGLSANEIAAYGGLLIGALGYLSNLLVTIYFKHQHLQITRQVAAVKPDCVTCLERESSES